jgi:hypothetical protein
MRLRRGATNFEPLRFRAEISLEEFEALITWESLS